LTPIEVSNTSGMSMAPGNFLISPPTSTHPYLHLHIQDSEIEILPASTIPMPGPRSGRLVESCPFGGLQRENPAIGGLSSTMSMRKSARFGCNASSGIRTVCGVDCMDKVK